MKKIWWKEAVVYQIYPRSFKDSTGSGVGDIPGIIEKLDYIKSLGVDMIWLCPVYESPNDDNGYDIRDYRKISEDFGGNKAFDELMNGIHDRGMKLIMDLVANHTSDEHHWFEESRKSKDNPYRDYYIWRKGENGGPPNNWTSFFSGSAWEYDEQTDEYYLHLFTKKQPDLNWENPEVRKQIQEVIDYWFSKGVDGFRMDVISVISKPDEFTDASSADLNVHIKEKYANGPRIHDYLREINKNVLSKYDIMTVGEGPGIDLKNAPKYVDEGRDELDMVFHFDHMFIDAGLAGKYDVIPYDLVKFKKVFSDWDECLKNGWGSIFLGNHDFSRMVSRFGNDKNYHQESAKLLATLILSLRGTVYIYQGDEIGMTNVAYPSIDHYNDVETLNAWKDAEAREEDMNEFFKLVHDVSRDNARTPMQWDNSVNAGFSSGNPWLKVNENYSRINVASQEHNGSSILNYYREMIAFRKANQCLIYGDYQCIDPENQKIYAYRRWDDEDEFLFVLNFSDDNVEWTSSEINLEDFSLVKSNLSSSEKNLSMRPWEAKVFKKG